MQPPVATAGEWDGTDSPRLLQKAMLETKCFQQKSGKIPKTSTRLQDLEQCRRKSYTNIVFLPQIMEYKVFMVASI